MSEIVFPLLAHVSAAKLARTFQDFFVQPNGDPDLRQDDTWKRQDDTWKRQDDTWKRQDDKNQYPHAVVRSVAPNVLDEGWEFGSSRASTWATAAVTS